MGISCSNRIVIFACAACSVGYNAAEFLVRWDLVEQIWQNGCIPNAATRELDGTDLQRLLV